MRPRRIFLSFERLLMKAPICPPTMTTEELCTYYRQLSQACDHITLVFDKGNNCEQAFDTLEQSAFHFVGSLVPTQHPDLLAVPRSKFRPAAEARLESVQLYRTEKKVFGRTYTVVVILEELGGIRETLLIYPRRQGQREHPTASCLTRMSDVQQRLSRALDLQQYAPAAS